MMIATVKIQLNASIAMAITQFFLATVRHGRKKKRFSKSSMRNQQPFQKRENSLKSNLQLQAKAMPASLKLPVYTFHALMHKRKQMKRALLN